MNAPGEPVTTLGIDVGGTKIAAALVRFPAGRVLTKQVVPTDPGRSGAAILDTVLNLAKEVIRHAPDAKDVPAAIGLGLCELVDTHGRILSENCIPWRRLEVHEPLQRLGRLTLEADVRAAALAESLLGAARPFRIALFLTIGTGISSCLLLNGTPYSGARGATGTVASSPAGLPCEVCQQAPNLSLEDYASGPALVRRLQQRQGHFEGTGRDVLVAAMAGNPDAAEVIRTAGEAVGRAVAWLINVLDPEAVIVGGGLGSSAGPYFEALTASARHHVWSDLHRNLPILRSKLGPDAGVIGAAAAAWRHHFVDPTTNSTGADQ